jgi:hypothetical protein
MKRFLFGQFRNKSQRRPDVVRGKIVFVLNAFERHTTRKAPDHHGYGHSGTTDDRLSVTDGRVNYDSVVRRHSDSHHGGFAGLVELTCQNLNFRLRWM